MTHPLFPSLLLLMMAAVVGAHELHRAVDRLERIAAALEHPPACEGKP
jgi:hypothetical protein